MLLSLQDRRIQGRDPANHRWIKLWSTHQPAAVTAALTSSIKGTLVASSCHRASAVRLITLLISRQARPGFHGNGALIVYRRPTSNNRGCGSTRSRDGISWISWTTTTGPSPTVGVPTGDKSIKGIKAAVLLTNFPDLNVQRRRQGDALIVSFFSRLSGIICCEFSPAELLIPFQEPAA